jgi:hypothetical protein
LEDGHRRNMNDWFFDCNESLHKSNVPSQLNTEI